MANSISITTAMTSTVDNISVRGNASVNAVTTSSNAVAASVTVNNSTWTALSLGSLANVTAVWLQNDNSVYSSSVVSIGSGSAGQNTLTVMPSGYTSVISWSGSLGSNLYGKIVGGTDATGVVQIIAQQA